MSRRKTSDSTLSRYRIKKPYCEICLNPKIEVHHIIFRSQGGPDSEENLISLCRKHHSLAHGHNPTKYRKIFQNIKSGKKFE